MLAQDVDDHRAETPDERVMLIRDAVVPTGERQVAGRRPRAFRLPEDLHLGMHAVDLEGHRSGDRGNLERSAGLQEARAIDAVRRGDRAPQARIAVRLGGELRESLALAHGPDTGAIG